MLVVIGGNRTEGLVEAVAAWAGARELLAAEVVRAAEAGSPLTDEAVFAHRAELTKRHLP